MEPSLDILAQEMHEIIHELLKKYQFRDRNKICCYNITVSQCYVLYELKQDSCTMRQLASNLYLDVSTVSRVVDQLETKRLVMRTRNPADRRIMQVDLTSNGRRLLQQIETDLIENEKYILSKISPAARYSVLFVLREIAKSFNAQQTVCCLTPPSDPAKI